MSDPANLPIAEMSGEEEHSLSLGVCLPDVLFALRLHKLEDLVIRQAGKSDQLEKKPPEVREHAEDDRLTLGRRTGRKRVRQVLDRDSTTGATHAIHQTSERLAARPHRAHRQWPNNDRYQLHQSILGGMP